MSRSWGNDPFQHLHLRATIDLLSVSQSLHHSLAAAARLVEPGLELDPVPPPSPSLLSLSVLALRLFLSLSASLLYLHKAGLLLLASSPPDVAPSPPESPSPALQEGVFLLLQKVLVAVKEWGRCGPVSKNGQCNDSITHKGCNYDNRI